MNENLLSIEKRSSINGTFWKKRFDYDYEVSNQSSSSKLNNILETILYGRNLKKEDFDDFLDPKVNNLLIDPSELFDMDVAIKEIVTAMINNKKIGIIGDYDVDGTTSSSLLTNFFNHYNISSDVYIPNRLKDGYGPNISAFEQFIQKGIDTVVTVDCGSTSIEPLEYAHNNGIKVIIIDHHKVDNLLPKCFAHINPTRKEDKSNLNHLAAVGLTFLFIVALRRSLREKHEFNDIKEPNLKKYLDVVALGTICDVVQLKPLNRAFVKEGLKIINNTEKVGLKSLCSVAKIENIDVYELGYILGPRINAAGRTGSPELGFRLLTSDNEDETNAIADKLNQLNQERQNIEKEVLDQSIEKVENHMLQNGLNDYPASIFVSNDNWHLGVLGIVASRLKEKFHRPSFVISSKDEISTASARSLPGIDIGKIIIEGVNEGILLSGGGHAMAGGFSLKTDKIEEFNMYCDNKIMELDNDILIKRTQKYDDILDNIEIDRNFYEFINRASPYGQGNPEPKFIVPNAEIEFCKTVGKGHLKLKISGNNYKNLDCIAFNAIGTPLGDLITHHSGSLLHFIGVIRKNDWQDFKGIQLQIFDAFIA
jgi:single-stranded-DNA-specific exonuclease